MKTLYTLKDTLAGSYAAPFASFNDSTAQRDVVHASRDPNSLLSQSPETFALFRLCQFDEQSGKFINPQEPPQFLSLVSDLLPKE